MNNLTKEENEMKRHNILNFPRMIAAVMLAFASSQAPAAEEAGFNAGIVTCKSIPGTTVNLLIHSSTHLNCTFKRAENNKTTTGKCNGRKINTKIHKVY